jgi:hypothetical protein
MSARRLAIEQRTPMRVRARSRFSRVADEGAPVTRAYSRLYLSGELPTPRWRENGKSVRKGYALTGARLTHREALPVSSPARFALPTFAPNEYSRAYAINGNKKIGSLRPLPQLRPTNPGSTPPRIIPYGTTQCRQFFTHCKKLYAVASFGPAIMLHVLQSICRLCTFPLCLPRSTVCIACGAPP